MRRNLASWVGAHVRWVALAAAALLLVVGATLVPTHDGDGATDTVLADATPSTTSTSAGTSSPTSSSSPTPTPTESAAAEPARTGVPTSCQGPLPPGAMADASCDAVSPHTGLPHPCIDPHHGCGWPDAHGATPAGPYDMHLTVRGNDVHVTWSTTPEDLRGDRFAGPVREFVVRLVPQGSNTVLQTRRLSASSLSTDLLNLDPGSYSVIVQELNDSGLSGGIENDATIAAPPTHSPMPTPTPSSTPSPSPTPSPSSS